MNMPGAKGMMLAVLLTLMAGAEEEGEEEELGDR
jgi:hypothetical protein